ncbi:hypothetical protein M911_06605 [Ectothiorhodospira haloalkaliphila]|uniref:DUF2062 domain-containing protein n=1 Tax=Ectothiorhodospira haloalkaliphila TaxID=421628 RepID=W8KI69_9GAMM|nr:MULTISPECIES: DUF2062 domain-containing protein [Ectothiorhodospira]AHK78883.1 hypothetical protein M911_06605 [Ectothiorhodospira haloalkaliphila]MCG5493143.1 DUF2062 domain-containing protein [Ectothiorhodospira variabilis]MCG5497135.1 DUF2062 domain-containing protein [Ectothiorhodospira variabilis]MCG5502472.1 DUF2062 domain-containing protein [Ectothiorhodospira variabilis]MCG5505762.1 DUF2062 domain-containing protein [Ectothiorhodospira variabilis]
MPRKLIKSLFPSYHTVRDFEILKLFGAVLNDPNLWHLNRRSVAGAFAVGLFVAFWPIPMQMLVAAAVAVMVRVNLPIAVLLVWITNPLTMAPIFLTAYTIGRYLMGEPPRGFSFEFSLSWFSGELLMIWQPLLLGSLLMSTVAGLAGYVSIRLLWRLHILRRLADKRRRLPTLRRPR